MPLDDKTREMIAFGVAMGANCSPCIQWHYKKCLEYGVTKAELQEIMVLANSIGESPRKRDNLTSDALLS